jgi:hypothetical protein
MSNLWDSNGDPLATLYIADPKLHPKMRKDRNENFTVTVHHADGPTHAEALRLEAAFLADPNWRTARDYLWAAFADLEPYQPENPVGSIQPSSGFVPTGRILVTQGRALPEFAEIWTSAGYSAFCLANPAGGWDCNEYTGDVLRDAGLNGMGFPASNFGGPYDPLEEDLYGWDETIETIVLSD